MDSNSNSLEFEGVKYDLEPYDEVRYWQNRLPNSKTGFEVWLSASGQCRKRVDVKSHEDALEFQRICNLIFEERNG